MMKGQHHLAGLVLISAALALTLGPACLSPIGTARGDGAVNRQNSPDTDFVSPDAPVSVAVGSNGAATVTQDNAVVRADAKVGVGDVTGLEISYEQAVPIGQLALMALIMVLSHRREVLRIKRDGLVSRAFPVQSDRPP